MNKKHFAVIVIFSLAALFFSGCSLMGPEPYVGNTEEAITYITINDNGGRTVRPHIDLTDFSFKLFGAKDEGAEDLLLDSIGNTGASLIIEAGEWNFTLKGYKDGENEAALEGVIEDQTISATVTNTLAFEVAPPYTVDGEGAGHVTVTIILPDDAGVEKAEAVLVKTENSVHTPVFEDEDITVESGTVTLNKDFPVGDFFVSIRLLDSGNELKGTVSELIRVRANLSSEKTITLDALDLKGDFYTVTFDTNGGSQVDAVLVAGGRNLSRPDDPAREGLSFDTWYVDRWLTEPFDFDSPIIQDTTIYAGWAKVKIIFDNLTEFIPTSNETETAAVKVINDFQRGGSNSPPPLYELSGEQDHTTGEGKSFKWSNWTAAALQQRVKFDKIFTPADMDKIFSISLWVYSPSAVNVKLGVFSVSGVSDMETPNYTTNPHVNSDPIPITADGWSQVIWTGYTHTNATVTQLGIEQVSPIGSPAETFYIDDIVVKEISSVSGSGINVSISGTEEVGETLNANASETEGVSYQWKRGNSAAGPFVNIEGAAATTYTLTAEDMGKFILVAITRAGHYGELASDPTGAIQISHALDVSISGRARLGQSLSADVTGPDGVSYQWKRGNLADGPFENITGATDSTYTLTDADLGKCIIVAVTRAGYADTESQPAIGPIVKITASISGTAKVDETVTANVTGTTNEDDVSYQWKRGNGEAGPFADIEDATDSEYTLTADDLNAYIIVVVTTGYLEVITTAPAGPILAAGTESHLVTFDTSGGSAVNAVTVAHEGKVSRPAASPARAGYAFDEWYADEELTEAFDFDSPITEDITIYAGWKILSNVPTITLKPVAEDPQLGSVEIIQGDGANFDAGVYDSYQWYLDGEVISSATAKTYTLDTTLLSKNFPHELSVLVSTSTGEKLSARCLVIVK
jgi:uncharacterized repeat protein (TIGR02543 family)